MRGEEWGTQRGGEGRGVGGHREEVRGEEWGTQGGGEGGEWGTQCRHPTF